MAEPGILSTEAEEVEILAVSGKARRVCCPEIWPSVQVRLHAPSLSVLYSAVATFVAKTN